MTTTANIGRATRRITEDNHFEPGDTSPRVFIVDDDPAMRKSVQYLVESVGLKAQVFESGKEFLDNAEPGWAGCAIFDVRMPGISGLDLQEQMQELGVNVPVIIMSGYADVPMAVRAMKTGAVDFVQKPFNDQTLLDLVQHAMDRDMQQRAHRVWLGQLRERSQRLTPRESEVMGFVVSGLPNKQIAAELGLSEKTIEVHRSRVMDKMEADSIADLVSMVMTLRQASGANADG